MIEHDHVGSSFGANLGVLEFLGETEEFGEGVSTVGLGVEE